MTSKASVRKAAQHTCTPETEIQSDEAFSQGHTWSKWIHAKICWVSEPGAPTADTRENPSRSEEPVFMIEMRLVPTEQEK